MGRMSLADLAFRAQFKVASLWVKMLCRAPKCMHEGLTGMAAHQCRQPRAGSLGQGHTHQQPNMRARRLLRDESCSQQDTNHNVTVNRLGLGVHLIAGP